MAEEFKFKVNDILILRKMHVKVVEVLENDPVEGRCYVIERGGDGGHRQKFKTSYLEQWAAKIGEFKK